MVLVWGKTFQHLDHVFKFWVDTEWKPDRRIGGFFAHTVNNHDQKHIITRNEKGYVRRFGIRKDGYWYASGQRYGANYLTKGWRRFYDYNF